MSNLRIGPGFDAIVADRRRGVTWEAIARKYGYASGHSAQGSVRVMAKKRGLRLSRITHAPMTINDMADRFMDTYRAAGYTDADAYEALTRP
jgi:hypothetical protein